MKPIVAGCMALVIIGRDTGKTVRCEKRYMPGEMVQAPDGKEYEYSPTGQWSTIPGWLCVGSIKAVNANGGFIDNGRGWGMYAEPALLRIDSEGDDELIEEFAMEECANVMDEQMNAEGVKRLW